MRRTSTYSLALLSVLCWGLSSPGRVAAQTRVLNGIAALVNADVITFSQVEELSGPREQAARNSLQGEAMVTKLRELRTDAVNELINRQLILQEFAEMKKKGAQIPAHILDEQVDTLVREQFGGDRSAFMRTLAAQGLTLDRFRQMEEEKIIVAAMRGEKVKVSTIIPETRIRDYYNAHREDYSTDEQAKLRMLMMRKSGADGSESVYKMMKEIREKIIHGAAFGDLARMYSEDPAHQEAGGDWDWVNRKTLNESLSKVAFALKPGEVSQVVELSGNYYLIYCEAKKGGTTKSLAELHDEIEKTLLQEDRQKAQEVWVAKLRKKAFIKIF
jgi:peptidyl-prolyl cis-trans isomerase SurA